MTVLLSEYVILEVGKSKYRSLIMKGVNYGHITSKNTACRWSPLSPTRSFVELVYQHGSFGCSLPTCRIQR